MKNKPTLQPHQTIWSLGRINWLQRHNPTLLISLHSQNQLTSHLLEFNRQVGEVLTNFLMFTPDSQAWDKTMSQVFPKQEKDKLKITCRVMDEIYQYQGLTPKIIKYLTKSYEKMLNKM